jgi:hypothetical protein
VQVILAQHPKWIPTFTGLSPRQFSRLVTVVRHRGGSAVADGRPGRRWSLDLADRVLLVATYYRTNLTMRQLAPLFGIKPAAVHRIIDRLGPHLGLAPVKKRHAPDTVLIVDGTLVPTRDHTVHVNTQLQRVLGILRHRETKTEESEAPLPLVNLRVAALKLRKEQQKQHRDKAEVWHDTDRVFTTRFGRPIEPRNFNRSFDAAIKRAAVQRITVHDARRTCGSMLADLDVHPRVAMQILRHAQFSMTMEIYTKVSSKQTRKALKRLEKALDLDKEAKKAKSEAKKESRA